MHVSQCRCFDGVRSAWSPELQGGGHYVQISGRPGRALLERPACRLQLTYLRSDSVSLVVR